MGHEVLIATEAELRKAVKLDLTAVEVSKRPSPRSPAGGW
jgi:hypothetical protein